MQYCIFFTYFLALAIDVGLLTSAWSTLGVVSVVANVAALLITFKPAIQVDRVPSAASSNRHQPAPTGTN